MIKLPCGACIKKKIVPNTSGALAVMVELDKPQFGVKVLRVEIPPQKEMTREELISSISVGLRENLREIENNERKRIVLSSQWSDLVETAEHFNSLLGIA